MFNLVQKLFLDESNAAIDAYWKEHQSVVSEMEANKKSSVEMKISLICNKLMQKEAPPENQLQSTKNLVKKLKIIESQRFFAKILDFVCKKLGVCSAYELRQRQLTLLSALVHARDPLSPSTKTESSIEKEFPVSEEEENRIIDLLITTISISTKPLLGVTLAPVEGGLKVSEINQEGSGLRVEDVILSDPESIEKQKKNKKPGEIITLTVSRGGKEEKIECTLLKMSRDGYKKTMSRRYFHVGDKVVYKKEGGSDKDHLVTIRRAFKCLKPNWCTYDSEAEIRFYNGNRYVGDTGLGEAPNNSFRKARVIFNDGESIEGKFDVRSSMEIEKKYLVFANGDVFSGEIAHYVSNISTIKEKLSLSLPLKGTYIIAGDTPIEINLKDPLTPLKGRYPFEDILLNNFAGAFENYQQPKYWQRID